MGPPDQHGRTQHGSGEAAWSRWMAHGGTWWTANGGQHDAASWVDFPARLPFCATVEAGHGLVGLVHACPVWPSWKELEAKLIGDGNENHFRASKRCGAGLGWTSSNDTSAGLLTCTSSRSQEYGALSRGTHPSPIRSGTKRARDRHRRRAHRRVGIRATHDRAERRQEDRDLKLRALIPPSLSPK